MYDPKSRKGTIGASDLPTILGLNPYADAGPWSIIHREGRPDTPAQALGRSLEAWLVDQVTEAYKLGRGNDEVATRDGWAHATPDGYIYMECGCDSWCGPVLGSQCDCQPRAVIEAKSVSWAKAADWRQGVPSYVYAQVQWQMWVTGAPLAIVSALVAGEYQRHEVPRDEAFLAEAVPIARAFWQAMTLGEDPPLDASHACGAALRARLEGKEEEPAVDATEFQETTWAHIQETRATIKRLEEEVRLRTAGLLQIMTGPILLSGGLELRSTKQGLRTRKAKSNGQ